MFPASFFVLFYLFATYCVDDISRSPAFTYPSFPALSSHNHRWFFAYRQVALAKLAVCCSRWFLACRRLIQECWDPTPSVRPTFSEIIVRLNKISASCSNKQTRWRDNFKLPWYSSRWSNYTIYELFAEIFQTSLQSRIDFNRCHKIINLVLCYFIGNAPWLQPKFTSAWFSNFMNNLFCDWSTNKFHRAVGHTPVFHLLRKQAAHR
jgi:hypothetical protein